MMIVPSPVGAILDEALRGPLRAGREAAGDVAGEGEAARGVAEADDESGGEASREENDELFGLYEIFRYGDGMSRNRTIEKAAEHCGYGRSRGYKIVEIREGKAS